MSLPIITDPRKERLEVVRVKHETVIEGQLHRTLERSLHKGNLDLGSIKKPKNEDIINIKLTVPNKVDPENPFGFGTFKG